MQVAPPRTSVRRRVVAGTVMPDAVGHGLDKHRPRNGRGGKRREGCGWHRPGLCDKACAAVLLPIVLHTRRTRRHGGVVHGKNVIAVDADGVHAVASSAGDCDD